MAVAFVRTHTPVSIKTAGTTNIGVNISEVVPAGNLIVARIVYDNAATASKPLVSSIAKAAGETNNWVLLGQINSTSTTAGAFASGSMWAIRTTVSWPIAAYTVTLDTTTVMKATGAQEFSGVLATLRSTSGSAYSTTTTAASATTTGTTPSIGDLALGFTFGSNVATQQAGDTDTTGGQWNSIAISPIGSTGGNVNTNNFGIGQSKILSGANHQTYNNSAAMTAGNGSIVAVLQAAPVPAITQAAYQFFDDAGTESGAASLAAQNTAVTGNISNGDGFGVLRIRLQSTNAVAVDPWDDFQLQVERNASSIWVNVSVASSVAQAYNNPNLTGGGPTTNRLTGGTGSFVTGEVTEDGHVNDVGWGGNNYTELVYSLRIIAADLANGDTIRFRIIRNNDTVTMTYAVTPTINLVKIDPAITQAAYRFYADGTEIGSTALAAQDTAPSVNAGAGDTNVQLRVRMQSTTSAAVPISDDFQLQVEKNTSGTWTDVAVESLVADSHTVIAGSASPALASGFVGFAESFRGNGRKLIRGSFYMRRVGTPVTTSVTAQVFDSSTTWGTNGAPTGSALAISTAVAVSALPTTSGWVDFTFDGSLTLTNGTPYFLAVVANVSGADGSNCVLVAYNAAGSYGGNPAQSSGTWIVSGTPANDFLFVAAVASDNVVPYNSATLVGGAEATTNRLGAGTGSFEPGAVSENGLIEDAGWSANNYTEFLYSITLKQADLTDGDTLRFRVARNSGTTGMTYTQVPTVSIAAGPAPQTWGGSTGTAGAAGITGSMVGGETTWVSTSVAVIGATGITGEFFAPPPDQTWSGGSTATAGVTGVSNVFIGGAVTWTGGSTATSGVAGQTGAFVGGDVTWTGGSTGTIGATGISGEMYTPPADQVWGGALVATIGITGISGEFEHTAVPPQTWTGGSTATSGATGVTGAFVAGPITWTGGSTATAGVVGVTGSFTPGATTWTGGSMATVGAFGVTGSFVPSAVTWTGGSTGVAGIAGITGVFVGGATAWTGGSTGTVGATGVTGLFQAAPITWTGGSTATAGVAGLTGVWTGGPTAWSGSTGTSGVAGLTGVLTSEVTWLGSTGTSGVTGVSGSFVAGNTDWIGSTATVGALGASGNFSTTGSPQTWSGDNATAGVVGVSGAMVGSGTVAWADGSTGTVGVRGITAPFAPGGITWVGSTVTAGVAGISGAFTGGATSWAGSTATSGAAGITGTWSESFYPPQTWVGSVATVGVESTTGLFVGGATVWAGSIATIGIISFSGPFTPGPVVWEGNEVTVGALGITGVFIPAGVLWDGSAATVGVAGISAMWVGAEAIGHWNGQDFMEMQYEDTPVEEWMLV